MLMAIVDLADCPKFTTSKFSSWMIVYLSCKLLVVFDAYIALVNIPRLNIL